MASPQPDKYTKLSNELLEAIYRFPFAANSLRLLLWIIRQSYGMQRKYVKDFSHRWAAKDLKMSTSSLFLALKMLKENCAIERDSGGRLGVQKDYHKWTVEVRAERPKGTRKRGAGAAKTKGLPFQPTGTAPFQPAERFHSSRLEYPFQPAEHLYGERNLTEKKQTTYTDGAQTEVIKIKVLTDLQKVMRCYKEAKGTDANDPAWDKANWNYWARAAKKLLDAFAGNSMAAGTYVLTKGQEWDDAGIQDWTLAAIARQAWDNRAKLQPEDTGNDRGSNSRGADMGGTNGQKPLGADRVLGPRRPARITHAGEIAPQIIGKIKLGPDGNRL